MRRSKTFPSIKKTVLASLVLSSSLSIAASASAQVIQDVANFNGANGAELFGSLTLGSNGLFYGTTLFGGTNGFGTIFSFDPGTSATPVPEPDDNLVLGVTVLGAIAFLKRQLTGSDPG